MESTTGASALPVLEARHIKLFTADWWQGYAPKSAQELAACLLAAQRNHIPEGEDYLTPWEKQQDGDALIAYELAMIRRSAANVALLNL